MWAGGSTNMFLWHFRHRFYLFSYILCVSFRIERHIANKYDIIYTTKFMDSDLCRIYRQYGTIYGVYRDAVTWSTYWNCEPWFRNPVKFVNFAKKCENPKWTKNRNLKIHCKIPFVTSQPASVWHRRTTLYLQEQDGGEQQSTWIFLSPGNNLFMWCRPV